MALPRRKIQDVLTELGESAFVVPEFRTRQLMKEAHALLKHSSSEEAAAAFQALGHAHVRLGQPEKALEWHLKALRLEPNNTAHLNNVGCAELELGRPADALDHWVKVVEIAADDRRARAIALANIAEAFAVLGDADSATEALAGAVGVVDKSDVQTCFMVARQAAILEEDAVALNFLARAFALTSGRAPSWTNPVDVVDSTPEDVVEKFCFNEALHRVVARARRFRELEALPVVPRPRRGADNGAALKVFEEMRPLRERANAAVLGKR